MARIAIVGAGAVAFTSACHLGALGHEAAVWAPGGNGTRGMTDNVTITSRGFLNGEYGVRVMHNPQDLVAFSDLVLVAVPAYGHKNVIDILMRHLRDGQTVILMSAAMSMSALYLARAIAISGRDIKVAVLNGPMTRGRRITLTEYAQPSSNTRAFIAAVPHADTPAVVARLEQIYGKVFHPAPNGLEVAFNGIAGVFHSALALCNLTRMETGEEWCGYQKTTESVSNLAEALDKERVEVATACGLNVPGIIAYIGGTIGESTVKQVFQPHGYAEYTRNGPRQVEHRYIEEEVPFNLATIELLGRGAGVPTPLLSSLIDIFSALRRRNYRQVNTMILGLGIPQLDPPQIVKLYETGFA